MVAVVFDELAQEEPRSRFTVGIDDDVSGSSIRYDPAFDIESPDTIRAVSSAWARRTVGANEHHQDPRSRGEALCPGLFRL